MKRRCPQCKKDSLTGIKLFTLGFGRSVSCANCGARIRLNEFAKVGLSVGVTITTIVLLVVLTNMFGLVGFVSAFAVPIILEWLLPLYLPLTIELNQSKITKKGAEKEQV
ncbi:hypothetical protein [Rheinheimera pacifica]|uniref:hypothetical protein n=1 Tax=Rheinheimera pacifica TaxID=173990 RepID=UPI002ED9A05B